MASPEVKDLASPEETRPFEGKGQSELVTLAGRHVGKQTFEPGWKWSENIKPIAGTDSCEVAHFGYCISGRMIVHMDDGSDSELRQARLRRDSEGAWRGFAVPRRVATLALSRAISSAGRAPSRQGGGHWFEPSIAHSRSADAAALSERVRASARGTS
jgi:hypothetical protein